MENKLNLRMMSPEEILNQKLTEPSMLSYGLKKRFPDETSHEIVDRLQGDLLKLICYERVEKSIARSRAEYHAMTGLVVVTRKLGKWNTFGYRTNNLDCLRNHEALYLIDTNRLELYYDSVLVSLEQAYALLLNDPLNSMSQERYFIYSSLSKAGYIVQPHRQHIQVNRVNAIQLDWSKDITPADKCVWRCLRENLKQPGSSKDISQDGDDELYLKVKQNMEKFEDAIKNQRAHVEVADTELTDEADSWQSAVVRAKARKESSSRKRKLEPSTSKKLTKLQPTTNRFLDVLECERTVSDFRNIFNELQVIQLNCDNADEPVDSNLEFDFDLYSARPGFKQSDPGPPNFRILIFKSNQPPPTRELIVKAFLKPAVRAPVIVFYVNELMRKSPEKKFTHLIRPFSNSKLVYFQTHYNTLEFHCPVLASK